MKILIDCRFWGLEHAGLGRYVSYLVENIVAVDKNNKYILLAAKEKYQEISSLLPSAKVIPVDALHYSLKEQMTIPLILKKLNYDLIHFPHFNVPIFTVFKKPLVLTIHDLIKDESRGLQTTTRHPVVYLAKYLGYKATMLQALKKANMIIVPSEWVKREVIKRYKTKESKLGVIYEGVGEEFRIEKLQHREHRKEQNALKILEKYKINKPYFIYVGSAYPHKNLRNLIFAIKLINQSAISHQQSAINLVIVCSRDVFWQRLKKHVNQTSVEKYVKLAGFVPDVDLKVLYNQAVAFITPSLMEGFGLPGIEAMAASCPVIASKKAALPEIYGQAVEYVDPENLEDIKNRMTEVLNFSAEKRKGVIQKGINQVKKYSWQKCAKETLRIYSSLGS